MSKLDEIFNELSISIERSTESMRHDLIVKVRGAQVYAEMLEGVSVDYYGMPTPLQQMATISVPEPRIITIKPWEQSQLKNIDKAIREIDLNLNPQIHSNFIRVLIPVLSDARRKELVRLAKKYGEESKAVIHRKYLLGANEQIAQLEADGELSGNEASQAYSKVEQLGAVGIKRIDEIVAAKEKEILTG